MSRDPWYYYGRDLDNYAEQLDRLDYAGVAPKPPARRHTQGFFTVLTEGDSDGPLTPDSIKSLLSQDAVGAPHGYELLKPLPLPTFPRFPKPPETSAPIQKPETGFSIFGSPWRAPKHPHPKIADIENKLHEKTTKLRQEFEQRYQA